MEAIKTTIESILQQAKKQYTARSPILKSTSEEIAKKLFYHFACRVLQQVEEVQDAENFYLICHRIAEWFTSTQFNRNLNITGSVGIGKSTLLKAVMDYLNTTELSHRKAVVTANNMASIALNSEPSWELITSIPILLIDDIGTEPYDVKLYGNIHLPFTELLEHRYNHNLVTVITTNLSTDDINARYGIRIADRINEFYTINYNRQSYRS